MQRVRDSGSEPVEGRVVAGRYRIEARLGRGGMGTVYRALDVPSGRVVALKELEYPSDRGGIRFRHEFHTLARLRHPRVVEVYDYGIAEGGPFYTMELLDGRDVRDMRRIPAIEACQLMRDVASALALLHARRLIHRDVAARNVRCTSDGRAKLIDFGLLATVGVSGEVVGTPPCIAPEALRGVPLDHRADLFGVGALLFWLLTGKHAFPARKVIDLEEAWRQRPPRVSTLAPGVPDALDALVASLLSIDPLARPGTTAEVVDRLGAIAGADSRAAHELSSIGAAEAREGYLASAVLVGRQREMAALRAGVAEMVAGRGRAVVIEAQSGTGKTRLLRELGLEAQLAGAIVLRAGAERAALAGAPYALVREIGEALLAAAPVEAVEAARARGAVIRRVVPSIQAHLEPVRDAAPSVDPGEDRMRAQLELSRWILDVARARPLAVLVDDLQRADEASAAVVASLAHEAPKLRMLVAATFRTDEPTRARAAVDAMRHASERIRLRGLDPSEIEELVGALFGSVPHAARLARWMHRVAGGIPLCCTEIARQLVERGVIRWTDGTWALPDNLEGEEVPRGVADVMDARIRALPAAARALAEVLSVHGSELPIELCVTLAEGAGEAEVFGAIDALVEEEVLVGDAKAYRFRHDGLRESLLRGLDQERRRRLHLRVGEALARLEGLPPEREAEVGWHLLHGGDVRRGAERLERAGRRLYEAQSFTDAIAPLEAALEIYARERVPARTLLDLTYMIATAGCLADRRAALRHVDGLIAAYRKHGGVALAERLAPFLGRHLALFAGMTWAATRWLFAGPRKRGPSPLEALRQLFYIAGKISNVYSTLYDVERLENLIAAMRPLAISRKRIPYAVLLLMEALLAYIRGQFGVSLRNADEAAHILATDKLTPVDELGRRLTSGAIELLRALIHILRMRGDVEREADELKRFDLRILDISERLCRTLHHRFRGEEETALALEAELEIQFVQLGSFWVLEALVPAMSSVAYATTRDVAGLRRTLEELDRLVRDGFFYRQHLELVRGEYHRERGDLAAARRTLERLIEKLPPEDALFRQAALAGLSEVCLGEGDIARAEEIAKRALAMASDADVGVAHVRLRAMRDLALAEAASGRYDEAAARLDEALRDAIRTGNPAVCGGLHESRARVALLAGDDASFAEHREQAALSFRATANPALIARIDRLAEAASAERGGDARAKHASLEDEIVTVPAETESAAVVDRLADCPSRADRARRALELLVDAACGAAGYLYLSSADGGFALAASTTGASPPDEMERELCSAGTTGTASATASTEPPLHEGWSSVVLVVDDDREGPRVVGAAGIVAGALELVDPDAALIAEIARALEADSEQGSSSSGV